MLPCGMLFKHYLNISKALSLFQRSSDLEKMPSVTLPVKGTLTKCQCNISLTFNNHSRGNIKAMRKKVPILNQSAMFTQHFLGMLGQC